MVSFSLHQDFLHIKFSCIIFNILLTVRNCAAALRTVPPFATAYTFCASCDGPRKSGFSALVPAKSRFSQVFLKYEKKIRGNHAFFRDN